LCQDDGAAVLRAVRDRRERSQLRGVHDETGKSYGAEQPVGECRKRGLVESQSQFADRRKGRREHDTVFGGDRVPSGYRVGKLYRFDTFKPLFFSPFYIFYKVTPLSLSRKLTEIQSNTSGCPSN